MADTTIDSLAVEVKSSVGSADKAIERLATSVRSLSSSIAGFDTSKFYNISNSIKSISSAMGAFKGSVGTADFTRLTKGLERIASVNVSGISSTSTALKTLSSTMSSISGIGAHANSLVEFANSLSKLGRKTVTEATKNIPKLTSGMMLLGSAMASLPKFDATSIVSLTSALTKLGGKSAGNAPANIQKLTMALMQMMQTLQKAPMVSNNLIRMTEAMAKLASQGQRTASASSALQRAFSGTGGGLFSGLMRSRMGALSLASAFGRLYANFFLLIRAVKLFKKAIDISSDLTEVQNVVDVTFGDMASKVQDLAETSIQEFGMSELTLKQVASKFQAIGSAMGISNDQVAKATGYLNEYYDGFKNYTKHYDTASASMADMSLNLTKLTADMASFYNVEQSDVADSLTAIFTGQTRPLTLAA